MSLALAQASRLKPELRLAKSVSEFEANLSGQQKSSLNSTRARAHASPPSPDEVMRLTAEIDRRLYYEADRAHGLGPRLTNFLQAVQQFAALGDVIVGGSQNLIACGIWALVRLSLLVCAPTCRMMSIDEPQTLVKFSSYLEKLSVLLMDIGRVAPRYQAMAIIYPGSPKLQSNMLEYFIVVVRLCTHALKFTQKSTLGQFSSSVLNDTELRSFQSELRVWADAVKEEVNLLMARRIESEAAQNIRFRDLVRAGYDTKSMVQKEKAKLRTLQLCSTYDHETAWKQTRKQTRKQGFSTLFKSSRYYLEWRSQRTSSTLIYAGKLGSGKSVLLANMVDDLHLQNNDGSYTVAYFFCKHDISQSLLTRTIIGSLAQQLLRRLPNSTFNEEIVGDYSALHTEHLCSILWQLLNSGFQAYFILDGLDECETTEAQELIGELQTLQTRFSFSLCISLRQSSEILLKAAWEKLSNVNQTLIPDTNTDLESFIKAKITSCVRSKSLVVGDPTLIDDIQNSLLQRHDGMFLWAVLQIQSLCTMRTDATIRQALSDLPEDLPKTFSRILKQSERSGKSYQKRILALVTAACRPLTTEELREALSVTAGDTDWDPKHIINDINSTLDCCGALLIIDEEDSSVQLVHHSVKQYLTESTAQENEHNFTLGEANAWMAAIIITYLNYSLFETQLSTRVVPRISVGAAPSEIVQRTLDGSKRISSLAQRVWHPNQKLDRDLSRLFAETASRLKPKMPTHLYFHLYSTSFWSQHVLYLYEGNISDPEVTEITDLLANLIQKKRIDANPKDTDGLTLLERAAKKDCVLLFQPLIELDAIDINSIQSPDKSPIFFAISLAAVTNQLAPVELLVRKGADLNPAVTFEIPPLCRAIMAPDSINTAIVQLLLENGADPNKLLESHLSPLGLAKKRNNTVIAQLLLEKGADPSTAVGLQPLLNWAVVARNTELVRMLLEKGANPKAKFDIDQGPLNVFGRDGWASKEVNSIATLLVKAGADVNLRGHFGHTALHDAAEKADQEIITLMVSKGARFDLEMYEKEWMRGDKVKREEAALDMLVGKWPSGARWNKRACDTPLHLAAFIGRETCAKVLLEKGANVDSRDQDGFTPLHTAVEWYRVGIVKLLLDYGADTGLKDKKGNAPLHIAAKFSNEAILRVLLERGADAGLTNDNMFTPLMIANYKGNGSSAKALIDYGASFDNNYPPLHAAVRQKNVQIITELLNDGADLESRNQDGNTPLGLATLDSEPSFDVVQLLLGRGAQFDLEDSANLVTFLQKSMVTFLQTKSYSEIAKIQTLLDGAPSALREDQVKLYNMVRGYIDGDLEEWIYHHVPVQSTE